jgi:hypothetical protein
MDASFCGAPIGKGKKMCVKIACEVTLHASKAKVSKTDFRGSQDWVFIAVPSTASRAETTAVYLTVNLPADAFGTLLEEYLREEWTLDQWTSLFASVEATLNPTSEEAAILTSRFEKPMPMNAYTPCVSHQRPSGNSLGRKSRQQYSSDSVSG